MDTPVTGIYWPKVLGFHGSENMGGSAMPRQCEDVYPLLGTDLELILLYFILFIFKIFIEI